MPRSEPLTPVRRYSPIGVRAKRPSAWSAKTPAAARGRRTRYSDGACVFVLVARSARVVGPSARRSATRSLATTEMAIEMHLPKTSWTRATSGGVCDGVVSVDIGMPPVLGSTRDTSSEENTTRGRRFNARDAFAITLGNRRGMSVDRAVHPTYLMVWRNSSKLWGSTSGTMWTCVLNLYGTWAPLSKTNSTKKAVQPAAGLFTFAT